MGLKPRVSKSQAAESRRSEPLTRRLEAIVPELFAAEKAFGRRHGIDDDETFEEAMGKPATQEQLAELEQHLGRALPPSYRAFLSLYDGGYFSFGAGAKLLGTADHRDPHIVQTLSWKRDMFDEFESTNPMTADVIPLVVGDSRNMILLEPPLRPNGEMDVVVYYLTGEQGRYRDLLDFFQSQLTKMTQLTGG